MDEIRNKVLSNRSDTLIAHRFRQAFGIASVHSYAKRPIPHSEWERHEERREVFECMAQRIGALDRGAS